MADISKINPGNGTTYTIKDASAISNLSISDTSLTVTRRNNTTFTVSLPADEKVKVSTSTTSARFPLMAIATSSVTSGSTYEAIYDTGIVINPSKHSVAEGTSSIASGGASHAEGLETTASEWCCHAEGYKTTASDNFSHAEGEGTVASGYCCHAEGQYTTAEGHVTHAEGHSCTASGLESHAEGNYSAAYGWYSHAEGGFTITSTLGFYAHAEGYLTTASTTASHAGGIGTIANQEAMTAIGKYNNTAVGNIGGDYLFVVGNGTSTSSRSNAFAVTTNGITASSLSVTNATISTATISTINGITVGTPQFTDTKVTSVANHYSPSPDSSFTAEATLVTPSWEFNVVKGVKILKDSKGHVTGLEVVSGRIPSNPVSPNTVFTTDTLTTDKLVLGAGNNKTIKTTTVGIGAANFAATPNASTIATELGVKNYINGHPNTDEKVKVTKSTTNARYPLMAVNSTGPSSGSTYEAICDTGITMNPNTHLLSVTGEVNAAKGFFQTSDINKKNIIGELDLDKAYDLIDKCQTILYTLKDDDSDKELIGLIAQEVKEFFPELITEDNDGALSLDYSRLTVVILKVLKDIINRIKILESK